MKNEITVPKAQDYKLEETKATEISEFFTPMLEKMKELEVEFNEVVKLDKNSEETSKVAKELRLRYVKVRTATAAIHKERKAYFLQGGKFVDGWKNTQLMASQGIEETLMSIEKHHINMEIARKKALQEERSLKLESLEVDYIPSDLGSLDSEIWNNYFKGAEFSYKARIEAEKQVELDKIEAEKKAEQERIEYEAEQEKIRLENERLKKEAEKKEAEYQDQLKLERAQREREQREIEEKARKERELTEKKIAEEKVKHEAELKAQREKQEKVEAELKAQREREQREIELKKEAEKKRIEEEEKTKQAELNKGDSAKVKDLINDLTTIKTKYSFKSSKNNKMYADVSNLLDKVILHINK